MKNKNILEERIKNALAAGYFSKYDCTKIPGKIDFAVKLKRPQNAIDFNDEYLLRAEAKQKTADAGRHARAACSYYRQSADFRRNPAASLSGITNTDS